MQKLLAYFGKIDRTWLATWIMIYAGFLTLDLFLPGFFGATVLKISGVFLCLIYAYKKFRKDNLLIIALLFTFLADVILTLNNVSELGIFVFCFAQFFHIARLGNTAPKFLAAYFAVVVLAYIFGVLHGGEPLYLLGGIYAVSLLANIILCARWNARACTIYSLCAVAGFILFFSCDFCVAASYLSLTGVLPPALYAVANYLAWLFYYPAQIFISNSSKTMV